MTVVIETVRGQAGKKKKTPEHRSVPGKSTNNPKLPVQLRKQLKKHYVNKYRVVKRGS